MRCFRSVVVVVAVFLMVCAPMCEGKSLKKQKDLDLTRHLPRDPLFASVMTVDDLGKSWDDVIAMIRNMLGDPESAELDKALAEIDSKLGVSLRFDVLPLIGPECAVTIDIPPVDQIVGAVMAPSPEGIEMVLGKIGVVKQVRDGKKLDQSLQTMVKTLGADIVVEDGLVKIVIPLNDTGEAPSELMVYYAIKNGVFALGFSPEWVRALLKPQAEGQALTDGEDFLNVRAHLDSGVGSIAYANLPRLSELVRSSGIIQGAIASEKEAKTAYDVIFTDENMSLGWGMTSKRTGDGVRRSSYGPTWMSGGAATAGIVAAIAVPNLINAIDRGREKRTMADMRTIATSIEVWAVDNLAYPGPTGGWVEVSYLEPSVVPDYIRMLPVNDGWGNPFMYWSDGESYRIISMGKNGVLDRSWDGELTPDLEYEDDIVHTDGVFFAYPEADNSGG